MWCWLAIGRALTKDLGGKNKQNKQKKKLRTKSKKRSVVQNVALENRMMKEQGRKCLPLWNFVFAKTWATSKTSTFWSKKKIHGPRRYFHKCSLDQCRWSNVKIYCTILFVSKLQWIGMKNAGNAPLSIQSIGQCLDQQEMLEVITAIWNLWSRKTEKSQRKCEKTSTRQTRLSRRIITKRLSLAGFVFAC